MKKLIMCAALLMLSTHAYADDFKIPAIPSAVDNPSANDGKFTPIQSRSIPGTAPRPQSGGFSIPALPSSNIDGLVSGSPIPTDNQPVAKQPSRLDAGGLISSPVAKPAGVSRFTSSHGMPPKPPVASRFSASTTPESVSIDDGSNRSLSDPVVLTSSEGTHNITGSGLYQNTIVMYEDIQQIFSSRKMSVEIRGPIAMLRFPSIVGAEVDVQVITKSFKVETFVFKVDNRLPAQKFFVNISNDGDGENAATASKTGGGKAVDIMINVTNGIKPSGYKWIPGSTDRREYMGIGIRDVGKYKKLGNEFHVIALTNETRAPITIHEWELHNSIVLGTVKKTRSVKQMSLDSYNIDVGKTVLMYVGMHMPNKGARR